MSLFKFKITPQIKESEWKISYVQSSQKPKTCCICSKHHPVGSHGTTFMKMTKIGGKEKQFETYHTCGHQHHPCTQEKARHLQLILP